jgi:hypothetical protein
MKTASTLVAQSAHDLRVQRGCFEARPDNVHGNVF